MKILLAILLVIFIYWVLSEPEHFTAPRAFGRKNTGLDLLDDSLFSNVITYNNDDDPYARGKYLGIDKCLSECTGPCVEYGITGTGFCFPK